MADEERNMPLPRCEIWNELRVGEFTKIMSLVYILLCDFNLQDSIGAAVDVIDAGVECESICDEDNRFLDESIE